MDYYIKNWIYAVVPTIKSKVFLRGALIVCAISVFFDIPLLILEGYSREWLISFLHNPVDSLLIYLVITFAIGVFQVAKDGKLNKLLSEKGFCLEYFNAFYEKRIKNKPVNNLDHILFAEIYSKIGDYNGALNVLNSLRVPDDPKLNRCFYINLYISIAVKKGDSALADDVWRRNQEFINKNINVEYCAPTLKLAIVYADCAAGRYERALNTCINFINSREARTFDNISIDFYVLRIYTLKKLGREAEVNEAVIEFNEKAKKWNPLFESARAELRRDVERAVRGELPV